MKQDPLHLRTVVVIQASDMVKLLKREKVGYRLPSGECIDLEIASKVITANGLRERIEKIAAAFERAGKE